MSDNSDLGLKISEHEKVLIDLMESYAMLLEEKFYLLEKCEDEICYNAENYLLDTIVKAAGRCGYIELNHVIMTLIRQREKDKELYSLFQG
jgi:hypothetical protein